MTTALSQTELPYHHLQLNSNTAPTQTYVETNKKSQKEKRHVSDAFKCLSFQFVLFKCIFSQNIFFCLILKIFSLLLIYLFEYKKIDKIIHLPRMFSQYLLIYVNTLKGKLVT